MFVTKKKKFDTKENISMTHWANTNNRKKKRTGMCKLRRTSDGSKGFMGMEEWDKLIRHCRRCRHRRHRKVPSRRETKNARRSQQARQGNGGKKIFFLRPGTAVMCKTKFFYVAITGVRNSFPTLVATLHQRMSSGASDVASPERQIDAGRETTTDRGLGRPLVPVGDERQTVSELLGCLYSEYNQMRLNQAALVRLLQSHRIEPCECPRQISPQRLVDIQDHLGVVSPTRASGALYPLLSASPSLHSQPLFPSAHQPTLSSLSPSSSLILSAPSLASTTSLSVPSPPEAPFAAPIVPVVPSTSSATLSPVDTLDVGSPATVTVVDTASRCSIVFRSVLVASLAIVGLVAGIVTTSIRTTTISRSAVFAIVASIAATAAACGFFVVWYFCSSNRHRPRGQHPYPYALFFDALLGSSFFLAHAALYLFSMIFYHNGDLLFFSLFLFLSLSLSLSARLPL
jgi:hypothetical protein